MPRFPHFSGRIDYISGSVYEKFRAKISAQKQRLVGLHIGDTYLPPRYSLPIEQEFMDDHPDFNRYCSTFGIPLLREALVEKGQNDNGLNISKDNVLVTNGASNALNISMMVLVDPGDEVLVLTPCWPFFPGMVRIAGGNVVEAPLYMELYENPDMDIHACLEHFITSKTMAIYLNTPNNPCGKMLDRQQLEPIAALAKKHNLWLISDEAYDNLTFDDRPHLSIGGFPDMFEQTLSIFTFSKIFMFAGARLGYAIGNETMIKNLNKMMVHELYGPATHSQYMMVEPVKTRHQWMKEVEKHYQDLRDMFVANLKVDFYCPEGTYFIFFSTKEYLNGRNYDEVINACIEGGVLVALGGDFGTDYDDYIRLCFTGEPPERLQQAIERLNRIFLKT